MRFKDYLKEALKPSEFRPVLQLAKEVDWKNRYNNIFKGKDRIFIPFSISDKDRLKMTEYTKTLSNIQEILEIILENLGWKVTDYLQGIANKIDSPKDRIKIGKLILKLDKEQKEDEGKGLSDYIENIDQTLGAKKGYIKRVLGSYDVNKLLKAYNDDPIRRGAKVKDVEILISRHPYDVAGMSTGRGWTSCMDLGKGSNRQYIKKDIKFGTLVAYLIHKGDHNLKDPIARILIKPYLNYDYDKNMEKWYQEKNFNKIPAVYKEDLDFILNWANVNEWIFEETDWNKIPEKLKSDVTFLIEWVRANKEYINKNKLDLKIIHQLSKYSQISFSYAQAKGFKDIEPEIIKGISKDPNKSISYAKAIEFKNIPKPILNMINNSIYIHELPKDYTVANESYINITRKKQISETSDNSNEEDDVYLVASKQIYGGVNIDSFPKEVQKYLNNFQKDKKGTYYFNPLLYNDSDIKYITV